ncbi:MAG: hypothetical protein ACREQ7_15415, partial [Candidatus Binatia bacterium]
SVLGRIPGLLALTLFEAQLKSLLRAPATGKIVVMAIVVLCAFMAQRWFSQQFIPAKEPTGRSRETFKPDIDPIAPK